MIGVGAAKTGWLRIRAGGVGEEGLSLELVEKRGFKVVFFFNWDWAGEEEVRYYLLIDEVFDIVW